MISRRALFGIGAGAAATAVVPAIVAPAEIVVGLDFGITPAATAFVMPGRTLAWQLANPEKMAEYRRELELWNLELDVRFDDPLPDA